MTEVKISYLNEGGFRCEAVIKKPNYIDHTWYSSKRNSMGQWDKHPVTVVGAFLAKLKNCKLISLEQYEVKG